MLVLLQIINYFKANGLSLSDLETEISMIKTKGDTSLFLEKYLEITRPSEVERLFSIVERGIYKSAFRVSELE